MKKKTTKSIIKTGGSKKVIPQKIEANKEEYALPPQTKVNEGWNGSALIIEPITTDAGQTITEDTAMRIPPIFTAIRIVSESIAQFPRKIYRDSDTGREEAKDHPTSRVLRNPNPYMTGFTYIQLQIHNLMLYGNSYSWIEKDELGNVLTLSPLITDRTEPKIIDGKLFYQSRIDGQLVLYAPDEILHFQSISPDGIGGYSVVRTNRQLLGEYKGAAQFNSNFYSSGANMGGVIKLPNTLSAEARTRLKSQIASEYIGNSNAFKIMVLEQGADFTKFGVNPEESQLNQTREFLIRQIAALYRIPPHKLGDTTRTAYNSIEAENLAFYSECLNPYLKMMEEQINTKLFLEVEKDVYFMEFVREALVQTDISTKISVLRQEVEVGLATLNEARAKLNLKPVEGGDMARVPANTIKVDNQNISEGTVDQNKEIQPNE